MDTEQFRRRLNDPAHAKADLLTMRENALRQGKTEHVRVAEEVLDLRFPGWNKVRSRRGGHTSVEVLFLGTSRHFETAKEAYIWMIERFLQHHPKPFVELDWETSFLIRGQRTLFFAKSIARLFHGKEHLASDRNIYHRLTNGWYATMNLSNKQKLAILGRFGTVALLRFGHDWDWNSIGKNQLDPDIERILESFGDEL